MLGKIKDLEEYITRLALMNAVKYGGRANMQAVLGKLFALYPDLKREARESVT